MSVRRFKFVSPGVFINEIDNSQLPREVAAVGPCVVGRLPKGPSNRPVTVTSFSEFVEIFGNPIAGGRGGDVWREGNTLAPTYAAYAAQAFLRNSNPVTVVRVLGEADPSAVSGGEAGWKVSKNHGGFSKGPNNTGGAYGLILFSSGSTQRSANGHILGSAGGDRNEERNAARTTGSLAAVWYFDHGAIELSGNLNTFININAITGTIDHQTSSRGAHAGNALAVKPATSGKYEFTAVLFDKSNKGKKLTFNFDRDSDKYIRKVFNTNPTLLGSTTAVNQQKGYFLGESFDRHVKDLHATTLDQGSSTADASLLGAIVALQQGASVDYGLNQKSTQPSYSPFFIGQDLTSNTTKFDAGKQQKLFRLIALDDGEWSSKNIKITIENLKAPVLDGEYGTFDLSLRYARDNDASRQVLENFGNLNLNPNSPNYIARRIGDMYQEWDVNQNRYRMYGTFENQSRFVRVLMNVDVDEGLTDTNLLPFGFFGPPRYKVAKLNKAVGRFSTAGTFVTGATLHTTGGLTLSMGLGTHLGGLDEKEVVEFGGTVAYPGADVVSPIKTSNIFNGFTTGSTAARPEIAGLGDGSKPTIIFPTYALRSGSSDDGLSDQRRACFGITTNRTPSSTRFDESYLDLSAGPKGLPADVYDASSTTEVPFIFTLDDIVAANAAPAAVNTAHYSSGSRARGESYGALRASYTDIIDSGFTSFTAPMYGGYDGLDIKEREPFGNHVLTTNNSFKANSANASLKRALDSVADPEAVEINMLSVPGVRNPLITDRVIEICEDRADALAVIDAEKNGYQPATETTNTFKARIAANGVQDAVSALRARGINSSYACTFFPWVKIFDEINSKQVWVPPSVVAIGTFASSERNSELWFAPAGFTRGGLSEGAAGLPVLGVSQRLTSKDRDRLYDANINPIAQFPAEGIVIFGQKTLQVTPSALDRINVRRLMIFIKKQVSIIASRLLFDQNVQSTWNRFRGQVEPFLDGVKSRLGLTDFKVILDNTTTTTDLIDRNILYAKVFLKPARAIEFIAIDFSITNSGASFDD